jgi:hypothetical protein
VRIPTPQRVRAAGEQAVKQTLPEVAALSGCGAFRLRIVSGGRLKAEFEEKTYESAANVELAADRGLVFSPGQVEEALLGYDAAIVPDDSLSAFLSAVLGVPMPRGVMLTPNWWLRCPSTPPASLLRSRFASLLLQYKRPFRHISARAPYFPLHGGPYFRYAFDAHQHETLVGLDQALNDQALVRYAAPCTIIRAELEQWHVDRAVLANTNFVSPRSIGASHRGWTYTAPGVGGYANRYVDGDERIPSEDIETLIERLTGPRDGGAALGKHLQQLHTAIAGPAVDQGVAEATVGLSADIEDDAARPEALAAVLRMRAIGLNLVETETTWWLLQLDEGDR